MKLSGGRSRGVNEAMTLPAAASGRIALDFDALYRAARARHPRPPASTAPSPSSGRSSMTSPETLELEAVDAALAGRHVAPEHAELAELALLLRDDRPEPSAAWATHLDRRVEAGFPARPRRRAVWVRKAAPALAIAACLLPVVAGAALIDGPSGGDESEGGGGGGATSASGGQELQPALREEQADDAAIAP